ncbi:zinc finger protein 585A-like [Cydia pomonella]|uniref:zinc finger protein 585A-like n=1 Tax=Cydia pomonella TaxID=82600 RepID=UPI002ADDDA58|nr:zinc finger protein 585A-like [Cydia pomonella]
MAQIEDPEFMNTGETMVKRSLLAKSKRAIIVRSPAGITEYRCVECPMGFNDKADMEQHLTVHNQEYRFLCGICGTALKRKEHLDRHTLEHKEVRPHICPDCGKGFKRKEHLNIHRTIHSGEKNHICPLCDKSFYRKDHLQKHLQTHNKMFIEHNIHPVSDQELLGIKQEVTDEEQADDDMTEIPDAGLLKPADPERPHICSICHKGFKRKDHLKLHGVSHLARDKLCPHCGKVTDTGLGKPADPERPLIPICLKGFKRKHHLKLHGLSHLAMDKPCPHCGKDLRRNVGNKAFRTDDQLHNHMITHVKLDSPASEEPYLMEEEYEQQEEESLLIPRISMQESEQTYYSVAEDRPYSCKLCGRRFKRKQHLKVHANVHARNQPPTIWCSICSEGFFNNSQFERHECMGADPEETPNQENSYPAQDNVEIMNVPIVTEEPEQPGLPVPRRVFVCKYCGKPFKRKDHYRIHLHVHTGVKSFFCEDCGKGFYRKDHLQKHSQVHTRSKTQRSPPNKPKKEMPELFPIHMLKKPDTRASVKPEITITAPSNTKLRVPLQIKVPYQVVTSLDNGERRVTTVDPRDLLS